MDSAIVGVFQFVTSHKSKEETENRLLNEIETVRLRLETVAAHFECQSDPDLVEACIYEMKSLSARYRFLLREAKKLGITGDSNQSLKHFSRF